MKSFLDAAQSRYTTKAYNASLKIEDATIEELKEILRLSPSSINSQPWKFFFISDENVKNEFAKVSFFNEPKVKNASHLVVFCVISDVQRFEQQIHENSIQGQIDFFNTHIKPLPEATIKAWMANQVYLSLGFFLSACALMGIDSTPMEGIDKEGYASILNQEGYTPLFAVAIGNRDAEDANQPSVKPKSRRKLSEVVQSI
jgi:nitroreductase/dihydropteridine reductase